MANNPTLMSMPICRDAEKNTIPVTDNGTTGKFSEQYGWQGINSLPLSAGGKAVERLDFNGVLALLGGIDYMTQRGYIFEFDESLDYVASCVVRDTDGGIYFCKNDVSASSTHPRDDATNWALINFGFNKKETFTSSGSFTAPVTGTYRITLQGGGGGGNERLYGGALGGNGGGQGGLMTFYENLVAGTSYSYTIGAGGTYPNGVGGTSSITINGNVYECYGGNFSSAGLGGEAKINSTTIDRGCSGSIGSTIVNQTCYGGNGGGQGGANCGVVPVPGVMGGGGRGQSNNNGTLLNGTAGGNGYICFEYCDL